jgi:DNA-binding LacI/PurR family transcriptional regulator
VAASQNKIAKLTGYSRSTVSRALANSPLINAKTKKTVKACAKKLGYQTNALVSVLTAQIRRSRTSPTASTLGYITSFPLRLNAHDHWSEFYRGAKEQAAQLGYGLDPIWRREPGMTGAKLNGILRARGIRGVIITPLADAMGHITMDFSRLAAATVGYPLAKPHIHHCSGWHLQFMSLALRRILRQGYSRIGYAIFPDADRFASFSYSSRFLLYHSAIPAKQRIPLLVHPQSNSTPSMQQFKSWFEKHQPEVLLCTGPLVEEWMAELGIKAPRDVGYANLTLIRKDGPVSGIFERTRKVGACAVDLVVEQIRQNNLGVPEIPKSIHIEGEWVQGKTL